MMNIEFLESTGDPVLEMHIDWLRGVVLSLRDPKAREERTEDIRKFPQTFCWQLEDVLKQLERAR
jgi:hypothetical protein